MIQVLFIGDPSSLRMVHVVDGIEIPAFFGRPELSNGISIELRDGVSPLRARREYRPGWYIAQEQGRSP